MVGQDEVLPEVPLVLRRLLLEDVAREGVASLDLALGGQLEALLGARVGLHLRHSGAGQYGRGVRVARSGPTLTISTWPRASAAHGSSAASASSRRSAPRCRTPRTAVPRSSSSPASRASARRACSPRPPMRPARPARACSPATASSWPTASCPT